MSQNTLSIPDGERFRELRRAIWSHELGIPHTRPSAFVIRATADKPGTLPVNLSERGTPGALTGRFGFKGTRRELIRRNLSPSGGEACDELSRVGWGEGASRFVGNFHDFKVARQDFEPGCLKPAASRRSHWTRNAGLQPAYRVEGQNGLIGRVPKEWARGRLHASAQSAFVKSWTLILLVTGLYGLVIPCPAQQSAGDAVAGSLKGQLKPSVEVFLDYYRTKRKYVNADFPMKPDQFRRFRSEIVSALTRELGVEDWVVRSPVGKASPIAGKFQDRLIETKRIHGVTVEIHAVTLQPTGLIVPMALCLPPKAAAKPVPGVCVFSGHTRNGLHDLVVNMGSYQEGVAIRLAQAGIASIAVEKIDTGYLSLDGAKGNDENAIATLMLSWGSVLRSHQIRACLAAVEILAAHERVDESRIGATGVSLGGWLTIQTAMLNDRIKAVADFGMKTRSVADEVTAKGYNGQGDLCHIIPGMLKLCDRNLLPVTLAPLPMLAGHGVKDASSQRGHAANYRSICEGQYLELGAAGNYSYLIHEGGDSMPSKHAIEWFKRRFDHAE